VRQRGKLPGHARESGKPRSEPMAAAEDELLLSCGFPGSRFGARLRGASTLGDFAGRPIPVVLFRMMVAVYQVLQVSFKLEFIHGIQPAI